MRRMWIAVVAALAVVPLALVVSCGDRTPTSLRPATEDSRFHVGYRGSDVPLGFVTNDAECHVGKKGARWPEAAEVQQGVLCFLPGQRETRDAQEVFTPSGQIVLTCHSRPE